MEGVVTWIQTCISFTDFQKLQVLTQSQKTPSFGVVFIP